MIEGWGAAHGGRGPSYNTPSRDGYARAIKSALQRADIQPSDIQVVEAHGTGTSLGDPIELAGITDILNGPLALGSVKGNIGHLDAAAGAVGVLKVLLCLERNKIVPTVGFVAPNRHFEWREGLFVPTKAQSWPPSQKKRALVNAAGFGGALASLVISEAPPEPEEKWAAADLEASR